MQPVRITNAHLTAQDGLRFSKVKTVTKIKHLRVITITIQAFKSEINQTAQPKKKQIDPITKNNCM